MRHWIALILLALRANHDYARARRAARHAGIDTDDDEFQAANGLGDY